jgi:CRISPR/Cas system-associated endonuclease Cas3-HD
MFQLAFRHQHEIVEQVGEHFRGELTRLLDRDPSASVSPPMG